jgi:predicted nucleotidyltransferase
MERADVELAIVNRIEASDLDVVAVYLFGSVARDEHRKASDVDVAVLMSTNPPATLAHPSIRLAADLESAVGRRVDVVVLNRAPADLVHRVLRDGRLLLDRDPSARIRFEVRARNEYFDLLPFLRRYRGAAGGES